MANKKLYGGIEGGGTKFVCMVSSGPTDIQAETRFPTSTPEETLDRAITFFKPFVEKSSLTAIGMASFGPVDLNQASPTYGYITTTPKPGWAHKDMTSKLREELRVPVAFELDVNAAAFGEFYWNPDNHNRDPLIYFTIGTGIGAGVIVNGRLVHGLVHPEAGHMRIPHDFQVDPYKGHCPYHGDCFEGLACGPAMNQRWSQPAESLPADHPAWDLEATYIASALNNVICNLSPMRIVLGGGVMQQGRLLPLILEKVLSLLNSYIQSSAILDHIDEYIVPPSLGSQSGVLGSIALAMAL